MRKKTNPNGANQYLLDPRQLKFWEIYANPKSETFGNAYQTALIVGYEDTTATVITSEKWFLEKLRRLNMLGKAEKVLDGYLEMDDEQEFINKGVRTGIKLRHPLLAKVKQDTAKFIAERLGKNEGYSSRTEMTGANGQELPQPILLTAIKNVYSDPGNTKDSEVIKEN